ncbi:murein hydrolase activator EnvC family protein [Ruminococcus albus]|uniref:Septal ring factor EnvC, activator of murein hydrolases AmiA and AmiB n=1 Tax=Ruminococcus albus TaxID=1264 RepID=A0A1I1FZZ1_RUMAL|nr:peptidoglycan DD-metalloendopeptidase family protein [Ruminococcus albus]SFC04855.1 Septal ring factor EnvC, activator of murein hydrolases AmiA and AmiB [Ruminococcus albus]
MSKLTGFKKAAACTAAVMICASAFSGAGSGMINANRGHALSSAELQDNYKDIAAKKKNIDELIAKQEELDKKIADTKDDISAEKENKEAIEEQIATVQKTIFALNESISATQDEISELEASIAEKEVQVAEKHEQIVQGVGDFKVRLKAMYVAGNNTYSDIIIGASDFYDMLMKMELVKRVAEHDDNMIDDLIELKDQYEAEEAELNAQKTELEVKQADLETQKEANEKQRDKLAQLVAESQLAIDDMTENKEIYENNLAIIEQEREQFEKDLNDLYKERQAIKAEEKKKADEEKARQEEERRKKEEEEKAREEAEKRQREEDAKKAEQEKNNAQDDDDDDDTSDNGGSKSVDVDDSGSNDSGSDDSDDSGEYVPPAPIPSVGKNAAYGYTNSKSNLTWPVPGHYNISYGFGWRNSGSLYGNHKGIDIWDSQIYNAEICAAEAGTVIRVENYCTHDYAKNYSCGCGGGYGRYCIIEHDDGKWTLYGHANNIIVSVGQRVEKEQVLGYVGSTGHSTGPHTHFEVQVDMGGYMGQVDPSNYV